jgi:hypothetical protein
MRQRLGIILAIVLVVLALVVINSIAFVTEDDRKESEFAPNRSTYNARPTGMRALHDFLNESGYQVMRWREPLEKLLGSSGERVRTFVVVGRPLIAIDPEEAENLRIWVQRGGRLVLIDRRPEDYLLPRSGNWKITTEFAGFPSTLDPAQPEKLTQGIKPVKPAQPTLLTNDIAEVLPSHFATAIKVASINKEGKEIAQASATPEPDDSSIFDDEPTPEPKSPLAANVKPGTSPAPVVHLVSTDAPLLVDYQYGNGRVVLLSDPFMVANNGLAEKDNLRLAINLMAPSQGLIAFDEFHQGHGATHNAFVSYFEGTPVLAFCGQILFLVLLILWSRGRRFARPLPLPQVDRRSTLEFVASMAELQQRARAYDLALENIYSRTRRVLARYAGVDYNSSRKEIAERIASRSTLEPHKIEALMRQTEEAINGGVITERQSIQLVKRMREIEGALGLRMRRREAKQSVQL